MPWRQLDLLKGKRQRGTLPVGPTEFQIHATVADYLRRGMAPGWDFWHTPNGGERPAFISKSGKRVSPEGGRLTRMGTKRGVSDILLAGPPYAMLHALEIKAGGERPDEAQRAWLAWVVSIGGKSAYADNVNDALAILQGWGAIVTGKISIAG
jgi:hypothetical protein